MGWLQVPQEHLQWLHVPVEWLQKGSTVPTVTEDTNRAKDVETAPTSILSKRHPTSSASENSDTSTPATFTISKSAKSRGRPKVRKQQKVSGKKERMTRGKEKATKLVQGTLVPVPSLNNLVKLLDRDYRYIDIKSSTQSLSERSVPQSKKAIAGIFTSEESENDIRYIFPQWFVTKAQSAIQQFRKAVPVDCGEDGVGVRVPRFGIYQLRDINAMDRWHRALKCITDVEDTVVWAVNTSNKRLSLPDELLDGVSDDIGMREQKIKTLLLRGGPRTPFGTLSSLSLLTLRGNKWQDDACMAQGLVLLQKENTKVGIIDPIFHRFRDREDKLRVIRSGTPFDSANELVLMGLHVDNNHWCGIVFDFRPETRSVTVFDPLQATNTNYYGMCDDLLKDLFGELRANMRLKKKTKPRQPDGANCGVMVLLFFECYIRGISMPTSQAPQCCALCGCAIY
ncbi:hypothetical protein F441_04661 [Phytophthora nicotianae CJ01A1]|uniref:Ubiquitin-like protease family profile domain-containing protein n=1 Tax=Phytophthora nicotianae CJ01A1 TaxID=1317063 RepID=W2XGA9_PHYNI|nr:hypothetical protein F441_04661 [Phytophthora nicotianae CJ01A1]